jgi:hypothetical protein
MKFRRLLRWSAIAAVVPVAFVAILFVPPMLIGPSFRVGSTKAEVRAYLEAEERQERHLPPFRRSCGADGKSGTNEWLIVTSFSLREDHVYAHRHIALMFSTNGTVTSMTSHWKWFWNL